MENREFITYGIIVEEEKFNRIKNGSKKYINKPDGGLWASPTDSEWGWKDWCEAEDFNVGTLTSWTKFILKGTAKLLVIDGLLDLMKCIDKYPLEIPEYRGIFSERRFIDFEAIERDGFDGVFLTELGNCQCHLPMDEIFDIEKYQDLNAWDCESVILFNLDHVEIIEKVEG